MQEVYPISQHTVYPYIGRRVSAVTHDGRHVIGTIKGVVDGKLMLEECTFDRVPLSISSVQSKKQTRTMHQARLSSYYGGGYGGGYGGYGGGCGGFDGGGFFFPFAILASLFILPFFCI